MAFNPVVAVCDACVLYPFHLRNVIVQASVDRLFQARWTDAIHDEWRRNLVANTPNLSIERLEITKRLMNGAPLSEAEKREAFDFLATADYREGLDAFLHKRTPRFTGR